MTDAHPRATPRLLVAAALTATLAPLNSTMLSVALAPIGRALGEGDATLTHALVTSYLVTSIVAQAPGGLLGDRLGHPRALFLGQLLFGLGTLLGVLAPGLAVLAVGRVVMAAGGALIVPSALALLRVELPPELRGRAYGLFGAAMSLAAAMGPLVGGQAVHLVGWRGVFGVNLLVLPVTLLLLGRRGTTRATLAPPQRTFDWPGALLFAAALGALVLGAGRGGAPQPATLAVAAALLLCFALWERRAPSPAVDLRLLVHRPFLASGVLVSLHSFAMYALLFELPTVCEAALGASPAQTGPLLIALMGPMVLVSPFAGRLVDDRGSRFAATAGAVVAAAGVAHLRLVPIESTLSLIPGLLAFGVGLALAGPAAQSASLNSAAPEQAGAAAGLFSTLRYLGGVAGTLLLGALASAERGPAAALGSHETLLTIFLVALLAAIPSAMLLPPPAAARARRPARS